MENRWKELSGDLEDFVNENVVTYPDLKKLHDMFTEALMQGAEHVCLHMANSVEGETV